MEPIRLREIVAAGLIALAAGSIVASPAFDRIRGLSLDILTALRWQAFGARHDPAASPAVVVAIDEESYLTPPFKGTPTIAWTREIGRVLTAIVDGGAKVVGFDIVFPASIEQSELPFGSETFGSRVRGFDRDFLRALALAARADKVVLGQFQRGDRPIRPSAAQLIAVGQQRNVRALNAHSDNDNIIRRMPLTLVVDNEVVTSMAAELASRALGVKLEVEKSNKMSFGGYQIPIAVHNTVTLNFEGGSDDIPTFSFADLRNCIEIGDTEFFRRNFSGKVVIFGSLLENEDLKVTSKRFATGAEGARAPRCTSKVPAANPGLKSNWISGVYIHATAINNLIRGDAIVETGRITRWLFAVASAALTILVAFAFTPVGAAIAYLAMNAVWVSIATFAFNYSVALPLVEPFASGFIALVAMFGFRFIVSDRDKRFLRRSFNYYLAPSVIERMLASDALPALGGEVRIITVYFSDIAGFSSFSEKLKPHELVNLMNEYLSAMTDIIEEHGGFVDKYIGDAIVAAFGAPLDDPRHPHHAVRAALRCQERLAELRKEPLFKQFDVHQRIGLNTGEALVGNIGSRRRFNYTMMGDTVNLASRLEGANKYFGTSIMASETTVEQCKSDFMWRELDAIRVKGRAQPVRIYEPVAETGKATESQRAVATRYAEGLAHWRAREFAAARDCFARIAADPAAAHFVERANEFVETPPGPGWEPVNTLEDK